jgi:hypothetical protein
VRAMQRTDCDEPYDREDAEHSVYEEVVDKSRVSRQLKDKTKPVNRLALLFLSLSGMSGDQHAVLTLEKTIVRPRPKQETMDAM